jgi:hypothetical protein
MGKGEADGWVVVELGWWRGKAASAVALGSGEADGLGRGAAFAVMLAVCCTDAVCLQQTLQQKGLSRTMATSEAHTRTGEGWARRLCVCLGWGDAAG